MNPIISIWFNTTKTINHYLDNGWRNYVPYIFFTIAGLSLFIDVVLLEYFDEWYKKLLILPIAIITGGIIGLTVSTVFYVTGKIWNGKATFREVTFILSLAFIPSLITLVSEVKNTFFDELSPGSYYTLEVISKYFSLKILTIGIWKIQKFDLKLALLNAFFPSIIAIILILLFKY